MISRRKLGSREEIHKLIDRIPDEDLKDVHEMLAILAGEADSIPPSRAYRRPKWLTQGQMKRLDEDMAAIARGELIFSKEARQRPKPGPGFPTAEEWAEINKSLDQYSQGRNLTDRSKGHYE